VVKKDDEFKFRVDAKTAEAAKEKAARLDIPLSHILRQLLRDWVSEDDDQSKETLLGNQ
jgi:antitoxin component of RelBE/YafQ-DinJ toxin-antitoxin module